MSVKTMGMLWVGLALFLNNGFAATPSPDQMVSEMGQRALKSFNRDYEKIRGDRAHLIRIIEEEIKPHCDFSRMTRLAVGRPWRDATPEQKATLEAEFTELLVSTYSASYELFRNASFQVKPVRMNPGDDDISVLTTVTLRDAPQMGMLYRLYLKDGSWKIYDVAVDGISLVATYRTTFADLYVKGGLENIIAQLKEKNQANLKKNR